MCEHKNTWLSLIHHLHTIYFQNPNWDLNNFTSFILHCTHIKHWMTVHQCMLIQTNKISKLDFPQQTGERTLFKYITTWIFILNVCACSLLAIQIYFPCFQSYFRKVEFSSVLLEGGNWDMKWTAALILT